MAWSVKQYQFFNREGYYDIGDDFQAAAKFERDNTNEEIARYRQDEFQEMLKDFLKAEEIRGHLLRTAPHQIRQSVEQHNGHFIK